MEAHPLPARTEPAAALRLTGLSWERIQLLLELDGAVPPLQLRQVEGSGRMAATRQWVEGGRTFARFNIFQGPNKQPLDLGRWTLVDEADRQVRLDPAPELAARPGGATAERDFNLPRNSYHATATVTGTPGTLSLDTSLGVAINTRRRTPRYVIGWAFRRLRWLTWRVGFRVFRRLVSRRRPVVLFVTRLNSRLGGNLKAVHDRMLQRGMDRDHEIVAIVKPAVDRPFTWRERFRLFVSLARADVIFLDDSFYPIYSLSFPGNVRIVQLWHASGAFKTVGYSRFAATGMPPFNPYGPTHKNTTHVIVSSEFDVPFYAEALGVPEASVHPTGIPRMDRFFDPATRDAALAAAREAIPQIAGHKVWLFAPTFRGDTVATSSYDVDRIDVATLHRVAVEKDAVVLFKMHPFVRDRVAIPPAFADRLIEASEVAMDVNDLLFSVDLLITDYSSIVFEYSVLDRPMLFFAYDLDEYGSERDFYVPFAEFVPGRIVRTFPELVDAIEREDFEFEKVAPFARRHFAHLDGSSTDRVIDMALGPGH